MASNLVFKFITDNSKLNKGIGQAKKQLSGLEKASQSVGRGMNKALAGIGVGLGIGALVSGLKDAAKAAVEDNAAQALLAASMRNVLNVTDDQVASTEKFISSLQTKTGILDDDLRPAYSTLIRSTKDLAQSERLLSLATDVSAGSGKDLTMVTQAIAKAYNGQFASLNKLIAGIDKAADPIAELEKRFGGLGEVAANNNPLARIAVIFNDIQEQIGTYVLPYLQQFAAYLASPAGAAQMQKLVEVIGQLITGLAQTLTFIVNNADAIAAMTVAIGVLRSAWGLTNLAVAAYTFVVKGATVATKTLKGALVSTGVGALIVGLGTLVETFMNVSDETANATDEMNAYAGAVDAAGNSLENLPVSPTNDKGVRPLNPKPGEVYTWFNYGDKKNPNLAVWWTQTWTGTKWTTPKKMTYNAGNGAPKSTGTESNPELERLNSLAERIQAAGQKFRDSLDLSAGLNENGDVFNVDTALNKVRKVVEAAKKVPALLKQLRAKGASTTMLSDIFALGPIGAQATASALLESGSLNEFISAEKSLNLAGQQAGIVANQAAGAKTYEININKANLTAEEIIRTIQAYEKKTGKKVVFGNG